MGNGQCQQHNRQLSDVNMLITEENVHSEESEHNLTSKITDRVYRVHFARNELMNRLNSVPDETLLYLTELVCQLNRYSTDQLKTMLSGAHKSYQMVISAIIKCKPPNVETVPVLSEQINKLNLLYELINQPFQQIYHRPVYDEKQNIVREIQIKKYPNNYVIKEDTVTDIEATQLRLQHWFRISQLKNPNILNLKAASISHNKCRYLTEYIDGLTLDRYMLRKSTYQDKVCIAQQMIDSIRLIHSYYLIHGDIKMTNFMWSNYSVILMDLDQLGSESRPADMTYLYTFQDNTFPTMQGDIWALGLCIYQVFFGQKIERGWTIEKYKERDFPMLQITSYGKIQSILEACLCKNPKDIWQISTLSKYI